MDSAIDAIAEIFTWVGFGAGALLAVVALIAYAVDGTWMPVRAVVEDTDHGRVVRWFDSGGGVGQARLTDEQDRMIDASGWADVFVQRGQLERVRLTRRSPLVRSIALLAAGLIAVGIAAVVVSIVLLFTRG